MLCTDSLGSFSGPKHGSLNRQADQESVVASIGCSTEPLDEHFHNDAGVLAAMGLTPACSV